MDRLPVIFRKFKNGGDIIAIFPTIKADDNYNVLSYQHIGQHGACAIALTQAHTVQANGAEIMPLLLELKNLGYDNLVIVQRASAKMRRQMVQS